MCHAKSVASWVAPDAVCCRQERDWSGVPIRLAPVLHVVGEARSPQQSQAGPGSWHLPTLLGTGAWSQQLQGLHPAGKAVQEALRAEGRAWAWACEGGILDQLSASWAPRSNLVRATESRTITWPSPDYFLRTENRLKIFLSLQFCFVTNRN